jgi:hypothetical protein
MSYFTASPSGVNFIHDGRMYAVSSGNTAYKDILEALQSSNYALAVKLSDRETGVRNWLNGSSGVELRNGRLVVNGTVFSDEITKKALSMIDAGNSPKPLENFLVKVLRNPSSTARNELLLFCEANNFMISDDGDIVAYKSVRGNYTDIHSGQVNNKVGEMVTMERATVDDRRNVTCSYGLHFASYEYASTWAGNIDGVNRRLMVILIDPADVVSIPNDYANQKGRCCRYVVASELTVIKPLPPKEVYTQRDIIDPWNDNPWEDDLEEEFDEDEYEDEYEDDEEDYDENDYSDPYRYYNHVFDAIYDGDGNALDDNTGFDGQTLY